MRRTLCSFLVASAAMSAPPAMAGEPSDPKAEAQQLFEEGLALIRAGKFAEACPKLERSDKLDPAMGTEYRLAECYENAGWLASAWKLFMRVAESAGRANRPDREAQAREHADALAPKLPKMTIVVRDDLAALAELRVELDGEPVAAENYGRAMPIDPGAHTITVTARDRRPWQTTTRALEGASVELTVPLLEIDRGIATNEEAPAATVPPPGSQTARWVGTSAAAVVGLAGIAVGAVLGVKARSTWEDALGHCKNRDPSHCDDDGVTLGGRAKVYAGVSTGGFVTGAVGLAGAVAIGWLAAPSSRRSNGKARVQFVPTIDAKGAGGLAILSF
jgi:hypothetical protein